MSRIGQQPIIIPEKTTVNINNDMVTVKSDKAQLTQAIPTSIKVEVKDNKVLVSVKDNYRQTKAFHGLIRSLIANMIEGVTQGFTKSLELQGTGYRVNPKDKGIELSLGFSHPVFVEAPEGITLEVKDQKIITVSGFDKQLVGQTAANIRALRSPDAYKGKGVRYEGEKIKLKPGKAAKAAGAE